MKNYTLIIIGVILILIFGIFMLRKDGSNSNNTKKYKKEENLRNISYTETDKGYEIYDSSTNEVITTVKDEAEVKIYEKNPDYNKYAPIIDNDENIERDEMNMMEEPVQ